MAKRPPPSKRPKEPKESDDEAVRASYEEYRRHLETPADELPLVKRLDFSAKRSKEREALVITVLERGYSLGFAAEKAGIHHTTLKDWRKRDADFNQRVEDAIERGTDMIEDEAKRRAVHGVDEPVFQQGECVGLKRVYSDTLMQTILGGRRAKYGRRTVEHSGPDGGAINHKIEIEFVESEDEK